MRIMSPAMAGIAAGVFLPLTVLALEFRGPTAPEPATLPAVPDRLARPIGDAVGGGTLVLHRPAADRPTNSAGHSHPWDSPRSAPGRFQSGPYASADPAPPRTWSRAAACLNEPAGPWGHSDAWPDAWPDADAPERAASDGLWWSTLRRWRP